MPTGQVLATRPLTRIEISSVLQGMIDAPSTTPVGVLNAAFWSTLENLVNWCNPDDVEAARRDVADPATLLGYRIANA